MNIKDFIASLPVTAETYNNTVENGLTKNITTMITNGLNNMDIIRETYPLYRSSKKNNLYKR